MAPDSSRKRLPFEPGGKGQGSGKSSSKSSSGAASGSTSARSATSASPAKSTKSSPASGSSIPEAVSQRMLRRMLVFSGLPTFLGVGIFFVSYFLLIKGIVDLPPYFVLLSTLGCFGLGVLGLTYGVLSASWDESRPGNWLGLEEFKVNFGRMTSAWRSKESP